MAAGSSTAKIRKGNMSIILFSNRVVCQLYTNTRAMIRPSSRCILFDGENISFDASLVLYI